MATQQAFMIDEQVRTIMGVLAKSCSDLEKELEHFRGRQLNSDELSRKTNLFEALAKIKGAQQALNKSLPITARLAVS